MTSGSAPVRITLLIFTGVVLVSYALASFLGIPSSESSPADSGVLRMVGWVGVALIANDGIQTHERLDALLRRIVVIGGLMATLGLAQFWTGVSLVDWISLPGFIRDGNFDNVQSRAGFVRSAGTASHPLEYGVVLCMALPLGIAIALTESRRSPWLRWLPVAVMAFASMLSVSRSALIGVAVGVLILVPGWPRKIRLAALGAVIALMGAVYVLVPGMAGTIRGLFLGVGSDSSTVSRTNAYDQALEIASRNPLFGRGFGTFLPQYLILDNQILLLIIELGIFGLVAGAVMVGTAMVVSWRSGRAMTDFAAAQKRFAIAASIAAGTVTFLFFDGLSFPMAAAIFFTMLGVAGSASWIATNESRALR
ncbi:O-antigen ligase family protein [Mycetocola zhadangensis]|uniref:O-antigen ligase family protein n=1 Tax=Mycetocola zhadangensis TaxID=1164595 RepID=UPI00166B060B|nr:O-antigen ligase family protein [Mycetocola zhadangensis]